MPFIKSEFETRSRSTIFAPLHLDLRHGRRRGGGMDGKEDWAI